MAYEKALSLISGGGGFTPAELVVADTSFLVKATPETIDSVFAAVGDGMVIYRTENGTEDNNAYAVFMGNITSQTPVSRKFVYNETAGGYVYMDTFG